MHSPNLSRRLSVTEPPNVLSRGSSAGMTLDLETPMMRPPCSARGAPRRLLRCFPGRKQQICPVCCRDQHVHPPRNSPSRVYFISQIFTSDEKVAAAMKRPSFDTARSWLARALGSKIATSRPWTRRKAGFESSHIFNKKRFCGPVGTKWPPLKGLTRASMDTRRCGPYETCDSGHAGTPAIERPGAHRSPSWKDIGFVNP